MIRNLLFSSILFLVCSCAPPVYNGLADATEQNGCIDRFIPDSSKALYNTQVNVAGKHLSGLLIIKPMPGNITHTVFTSETGITYFDFEFSENDFRVVYCMPKLNKKAVIGLLKTDFGMLLRHQMKRTPDLAKADSTRLYFGFSDHKNTTWYITDKECKQLKSIEHTVRSKKKIIVNLMMAGTQLPDSVYIDHQTFNFNISLNKIYR